MRSKPTPRGLSRRALCTGVIDQGDNLIVHLKAEGGKQVIEFPGVDRTEAGFTSPFPVCQR